MAGWSASHGALRPVEPGEDLPSYFSRDVTAARRFCLGLNPSGREQLVVTCGALEHGTSSYAIDRDDFPFYGLEYVASGRGRLVLAGAEHALQPGSLFSYGPRARCRIANDCNDPLVKYFVGFAGRNARGLLRSCGLAPGTVDQVIPHEGLGPLFDEIIQSGRRYRDTDLCSRLLECVLLKCGEKDGVAEEAEASRFATYLRCRHYIEQHFERLRTLKAVAAECRLSNPYLCRLFRSYDCQSPYQYLLRLKMKRAADLLRHPGVGVKEVAEQLGYPDAFHFSRVFRNVIGVAPSRIRK